MNIIRKEESVELCTEAGWYAYDYELEHEITEQDIACLQTLGGSFLYMKQLKEPFYKLEQKYLMIKGIQGKRSVRVAVYKEAEEELCKKAEDVFLQMPGPV